MKIRNFFRFIKWDQEKPDFRYSNTKVVDSVGLVPENVGNDIFLVRSNGKNKWLIFNCPGGHQHRIEVNLMRSVHPYWTLKTSFTGRVSLYPSVDVPDENCRCHFWLKNSNAYMAKYFGQ